MFEIYLQDAHAFFEKAAVKEKSSKPKISNRYFRASIFYSASAMEAFVNYIGTSFDIAGSLLPNETAFLNDKELWFDPSKGAIIERKRYYSVEDKLKFLIHKFCPTLDIGTSVSWSNYVKFKSFRDELVHPKQLDDDFELTDYHNVAHDGLMGIIDLINDLLIGIFKKPLRKQILDLKPD